MKRLIAPALGLLLPAVALAPAVAQQPGPLTESEYCEALVSTYNRYLGQTSARSQHPDVVAGNAISDCQKGNAARGIPVLEQKLRNAGFSLPVRETLPTRN